MKDQTDQFDKERKAMCRTFHGKPVDTRSRDICWEAIWWIGILACLAALIYGALSP